MHILNIMKILAIKRNMDVAWLILLHQFQIINLS